MADGAAGVGGERPIVQLSSEDSEMVLMLDAKDVRSNEEKTLIEEAGASSAEHEKE